MNCGGSISVQRSLRLISLSNYVFVLEISQISGIVQNVSMLIMVVMRIAAVVGEEQRKGEGVSLQPKALHGPIPFIKYKYPVMGDAASSQEFQENGKFFTCVTVPSIPPSSFSFFPPFPPVQGVGGYTYLWQTTKRSPLIFPPCVSAARVSQHQGCKCFK